MAARSHLFPFRTEKLSSLSPMVLNFGRVGSRRFQGPTSLRLDPFLSCAGDPGPYRRCAQRLYRLPSAGADNVACGDVCLPTAIVRQCVWKTPQSEAGVTRDEVPGMKSTMPNLCLEGNTESCCLPTAIVHRLSSNPIHFSILFPTFVTI